MVAIGLAAAVAVPAVNAEGWRQAAELGLALALSATIGLEREIRQKTAGHAAGQSV
jgi:putative Mg2+ transporter-C (MgtC) family protein